MNEIHNKLCDLCNYNGNCVSEKEYIKSEEFMEKHFDSLAASIKEKFIYRPLECWKFESKERMNDILKDFHDRYK